MVPYDLLIKCIHVPLWKQEVVEEFCFDSEFFLVVECWPILVYKRVVFPMFEYAPCCDHYQEAKAKGNVCVGEFQEGGFIFSTQRQCVVAMCERFVKVLLCKICQ